MNIKIPYNFIGKLDDKEFVSFILDKNQKPVHRMDINRKNNPNFFLKKMEFISVDDKLYEESDSVVFFPFLKNGKGWGNKVVLEIKNKKLSNTNGGLEYVRNQDELGDPELLKRWISDGLNIPITEKIRGNKNLIYFSVFGKNYVELLKVLIAGLKSQSYKDFDLLFITDKPTKTLISKLKISNKFKVDYVVVDKIVDPVLASMQKMRIFEYKNINNYSKILFLDLDILVIGNLKEVFDKKIYPNKFYSSVHRYNNESHNTSYNTIYEYSKTQLDKFDKLNIFPFNAGQFIFLNTSTMEKHINNIKDFVKIWNGKYFFEQSFMNTYFNTLQMSDVFKFKDEFNFVLINVNDKDYKTNPDSVFVHFIGSVSNAKEKLKFIKTNYKHLLPDK